MQSLTAKLDIQILHGKYYLRNLDTMLQKITQRAVVEFDVSFAWFESTSSILGMEKVQQFLRGGYIKFWS